jgi:glycosyltransferase involved in cell wall biosynthesis
VEAIRVEYVIDHLNVGGAQRHLVELFSELDRSRFRPQVSVGKPGGALVPTIERMGIPVRPIGLGASLARPETARRILETARRLRRERVTIVHGYLYLGNILGLLAGRLAGVPVRIASKRSLDRYPRRSQLFATRLANRFAHRILCNADAVRRFVLEVERPDPRKLVVIPNGIRLPVESGTTAGPPRVRGRARFLVGTVGRLTWKKAHGDFLEAARAVREVRDDVEFVIVGDGPLRQRAETQAAALGIAEHVHFLGEVGNARALLERFDVFVMSSVIEGMPNVLLEALAAERPVVVTRAGGMPEIVTHEHTGLLVPPADPGALAAGILRLLTSPEEARRFATAGRALVERQFSAAAMRARFIELYEELMAGGGRDGSAARSTGQERARVDHPAGGRGERTIGAGREEIAAGR